jgi:hypothetical protein
MSACYSRANQPITRKFFPLAKIPRLNTCSIQMLCQRFQGIEPSEKSSLEKSLEIFVGDVYLTLPPKAPVAN